MDHPRTFLGVAVALFFLVAGSSGSWGQAAPEVAAPSEEQAPKVLVNADVVAMTAAHLDESVIVLAVKQGRSHFTTTPEALIALKNDGVSDKVIAAMLEAGGKAAGPPARRVNPLDYQPGVSLLDGDRKIRLQRPRTSIEMPSAFKRLVPGLRPTSTTSFPGARAALRLQNPTPTFEVRYMNDVEITGQVFLFRLGVESDHRELDMPFLNVYGGGGGPQHRDDLIPCTLTALPREEGATTLARYSLSPVSPLPPGEYAFYLYYLQSYYDFGVDREP
jgi:hypothetical protein